MGERWGVDHEAPAASASMSRRAKASSAASCCATVGSVTGTVLVEETGLVVGHGVALSGRLLNN